MHSNNLINSSICIMYCEYCSVLLTCSDCKNKEKIHRQMLIYVILDQ